MSLQPGFANPDIRPLPYGWEQYYDSRKHAWYYVQVNVPYPQATYTHPLGPLGQFTPSPDFASNEKRSLAQQLYATSSSRSYEPTYPQQYPNTNDLSSSRYSPTSSYSPNSGYSPNSNYSPQQTGYTPSMASSITASSAPMLPTPSLYPIQDSPVETEQTHSATDFYNNSVSSHNRKDSLQAQFSKPKGSHQTHHSSAQGPHRRQTSGPSEDAFHPDHSRLHRASTVSTSSPPAHAKPKGTPNLSLTARPPSFGDEKQKKDSLGSPTSPVSPPAYTANTQFNPGQTGQGLYNTHSIPTFNTLHPMTQPQFQLQAQPQYFVPTIAAPEPPKQKFGDTPEGQALKKLGKGAGKVALRVAGSALFFSTGIPAGVVTGIGSALGTAISNGLFGGDQAGAEKAVGAIASGVAQMGPTGSGPTDLQAVLQGQPGFDYQTLINTLRQQQQQAPPQLANVNYQLLIVELQRIQAVANARQQLLAQQNIAQAQANANANVQRLQQVLAQQQAQQQVQQFQMAQVLAQQQIQQATLLQAANPTFSQFGY